MKVTTPLLVGLAAGIGIGYYLATDDKEELLNRVKNSASEAKNLIEDGIERGKKLLDDIKVKAREA